ncbi:MAG: hypothetical protein SFY68_15080, partial [Candidatus Sumerlaeia bacterium]|nr:hypothetical protein [Candidatus Sumerlaeia bacterium]
AEQTLQLVNPTTFGVPSAGGNALRVVDTVVGGLQNYVGDAQLGSTRGMRVETELYIPPDPTVAELLGVGFCATLGTRFFSHIPSDNGYENGYWVLYTTNPTGPSTAGLPASATPKLYFVLASNDQMDGEITRILAVHDPDDVGITPGEWSTVELVLDPNGPDGEQLLARVNGAVLYLGNIPQDGPTRGMVSMGYRVGLGTGVPTYGGTWIDNLVVDTRPGSMTIADILNPILPTEDRWLFFQN